jgi:hypothetical protein
MLPEDGSWEMADGAAVSGEDGGWRIEDGTAGSIATGSDGAKPIRNGGCSPGDFDSSIAGTGFRRSGKLGSTGAEISGDG